MIKWKGLRMSTKTFTKITRGREGLRGKKISDRWACTFTDTIENTRYQVRPAAREKSKKEKELVIVSTTTHDLEALKRVET